MATGDQGAQWKQYCYCSTSNKNMQFEIKLQHSGDGNQGVIGIDDVQVVNMNCGEYIIDKINACNTVVTGSHQLQC